MEEELATAIGRDALEIEIIRKTEAFHGFLTRDAAIRLIAKEKGLLAEKSFRLAEIPEGGKRLAFSARVRKVWPVAQYSSGKKSQVIEVQDDHCAKPLIVWNKDIELARRLRCGDAVEVRGAYEKNGELHLGYSGSLKVVAKSGFIRLIDAKEEDCVHVRGSVREIEGYDSFVEGMDTVRGFSFLIGDGSGERRVVIFEDGMRGEKLGAKDEVIIENAYVRKGNVVLDSASRIFSRRPDGMLIGKLEGIRAEGDVLAIVIEKKRLELSREDAMRFLKAQVKPDIALSTLVELKKDALLNNMVALRIEEKNGKIFMRG